MALPSHDVDIVLDFVWGESAAKLMVPLIGACSDRGHPLTWIQIGSVTDRR